MRPKNKIVQYFWNETDIFALWREPTPSAELRIETYHQAFISVPPYRMTPGKKEILRKRNSKTE